VRACVDAHAKNIKKIKKKMQNLHTNKKDKHTDKCNTGKEFVILFLHSLACKVEHVDTYYNK
jgi:hypothetical protein